MKYFWPSTLCALRSGGFVLEAMLEPLRVVYTD